MLAFAPETPVLTYLLTNLHGVISQNDGNFSITAPITLHIAELNPCEYGAPVHRPVAVQEVSARKQVCVLNDPPYSPDLSPCDYFLFPN
jgi:histone-lysine N-methyltransferase SETMAR